MLYHEIEKFIADAMLRESQELYDLYISDQQGVLEAVIAVQRAESDGELVSVAIYNIVNEYKELL